LSTVSADAGTLQLLLKSNLITVAEELFSVLSGSFTVLPHSPLCLLPLSQYLPFQHFLFLCYLASSSALRKPSSAASASSRVCAQPALLMGAKCAFQDLSQSSDFAKATEHLT